MGSTMTDMSVGDKVYDDVGVVGEKGVVIGTLVGRGRNDLRERNDH